MEIDDSSDIVRYYASNGESTRCRRQQLEFAICLRLLQRYLREPKKILELGCGAGFYTMHLALHGHRVTAVDSSQELLVHNRQAIASLGHTDTVRHFLADVRHLPQEIGKGFDAILLMGPMYHIFDKRERLNLMRRCHQLLDENGLLLTSFLNRAGYLAHVLARQPDSLRQFPNQMKAVLQSGYDPSHPRDGQFRGYFADLCEISELHAQASFKLTHTHVLDPGIGAGDENFNRLDEELKDLWANLLTQYSEQKELFSSGRTLMTVARRR